MVIDSLRLLAPAVFVVDRKGKVCHAQVVPEIAKEPDYGAVFDAVRQAVR